MDAIEESHSFASTTQILKVGGLPITDTASPSNLGRLLLWNLAMNFLALHGMTAAWHLRSGIEIPVVTEHGDLGRWHVDLHVNDLSQCKPSKLFHFPQDRNHNFQLNI